LFLFLYVNFFLRHVRVATGVYPCCSPQANFSKWQSNFTPLPVVVALNKLQ